MFTFWQKLTSGSTNRKIFGAAVIVALGTVVVKLASLAKELMIAWRFGTGEDLDAFLIALVVPFFLMNVIAGSFNSALIPTYIQVREQEGKEAAQRLFSGAVVWSLGLLLITTILVVVTAPLYLPFIAQEFPPEKLDLTFRLLCWIAPVVLLSGIKTIWGAVLNAGERFALAALSPIMTPIITAVLLIGCWSWGVFSLAVGLVLGTALETIVLGVGLNNQGISIRPKWYGLDTHLRQVAGQYAPMIAGAVLMCSTNLVDQSMAAMLSGGSVAALNYGSKVIALPLQLGATALGTAVIPYFSRMVACQDWGKLKHTFHHYLKLIFVCTIPLTVFIVLASEPLVQVLYQRGAFTEESTAIVAQVQASYALQIPFYISSILVVRLISSLRLNYILMWGSGLNLMLNIVLNCLLIDWLGVSGISLSTSCVYLCSFLFVTFSLKAKIII